MRRDRMVGSSRWSHGIIESVTSRPWVTMREQYFVHNKGCEVCHVRRNDATQQVCRCERVSE